MQTKKWLLTTLLCSALFTGGVFPQNASAAGLLKPNSDWAVSKLAASQDGKSYCALARRFDNNMILTFARNAGDKSSLAIDFQKSDLSRSDTYNVALNPGFGQERSFSAKPVSDKAIVIRLGKDYAFYDALGRSGKMDVSVGGQDYAFDLSDFSDGQQKMGVCLANLIEPAAGGDHVDVASPQPAPVPSLPKVEKVVIEKPANNALLNKEIIAKQVQQQTAVFDKEIESLREENTRLRNALERERRNYEDRYMLESKNSSLAAEMGERIRILEIENDKLKQNLSKTAAVEEKSCVTQNPELISKIEGELSSTRAENEKLKQSLSSNKGLQQQLITDLRNENEALKKSLQKASAHAVDLQDMALLRSENEKLKNDMEHSGAALQQEITLLRSQNQKLQSSLGAGDAEKQKEITALSDENLSLRREVAAQKARNETLAKQIAAHNDSGKGQIDTAVLDTLRARVAELEQQNKKLRDEQAVSAQQGAEIPVSLAQLRSVEEQLRYVQQDRDKLFAQLKDIQEGKANDRIDISSDNWNLEQATRRFNEAEREVRRLSRQLEESRTQCAADKKNLEYMLFDPDVAKKEQISKLVDLEKAFKEARIEIESQQKHFEKKLAALDPAPIIKEKEELAKRSNHLEAENNALSSQIAILEKEVKDKKLAESSALTQMQDLNARLAKLVQTNERLTSDRSLLRQERDKLAEQGDTLSQKVSALETSIIALREDAAQNELTAQDVQKKNDRIAALTKANEELLGERSLVEQERDKLAKQEIVLNEKIAALNGQVTNLQTSIASLQGEVQDKAKLAQGVQDKDVQIATLLEKNDTLMHERNILEQERNKLTDQQEFLDQQVEALKVSLVSMKTETDAAASQELQERDLQIAALTEQNDALMHERNMLEQERNKLADQKNTLDKKVVDLEEDISAVRADLARSAQAEEILQKKEQRITALEEENNVLLQQQESLQKRLDQLVSRESALGEQVAALESSLAAIQTSAGPASLPDPVQVEAVHKNAVVHAPVYDDLPTENSASIDMPMETPPVVMSQPTAPVSTPASLSMQSLASVLSLANISLAEPIERNESAGSGVTAYDWFTGTLYGSAEQVMMESPAQFDSFVNDYLAKTKTRCRGDFGVVPVVKNKAGAMNISAYEIACIGGENGAAASIVFYNDGNMFTTIAHEAGVDSMDAAMDVRDRLVTSLMNTQVAAR